MTDIAKPASSPALNSSGGRRARLQAARHNHSHIPIPNGSEMKSATFKVRDECTHLALIIEERCAEGPAKEYALKAVMEAQMWAIQSISHRQ